MIAPLAVHVPILITLSLTLRRALELPGSNMATEGFLWLTTLDVPDPIGVLPLLGAVIECRDAWTKARTGHGSGCSENDGVKQDTTSPA
jgi:inner membrane protein COX18